MSDLPLPDTVRHQDSGLRCLVYHDNGSSCMKCVKCGEWIPLPKRTDICLSPPRTDVAPEFLRMDSSGDTFSFPVSNIPGNTLSGETKAQ